MDIDALSRLLGRRAFLRLHQMVSHGLLFGTVAWMGLAWR